MTCKPCRHVFTGRYFHLSVREPLFLRHDRPAATAPLPADRGRLRERAKSYAKALANDILR
ncbi:hypothetical protein FEQ43_24885 [Salmonella enterica]|nr:hypothetical protein CXG97_27600 [Escherichia coli]EAA3863495.1 hypothetical protein [Salmonella enterica subsp. enterica serovar Typhimurium]EAM6649166.1 hypothetical protein [Salmonella enterica]EBH0401068.1 hypothetical protein [Salmonella enterica subsp. enterica serovar Anatum]EBL5086656.1 hypothetical protein [Salmonella enterica subsp. enterica serovar Kentucky]EBZ8467746.1 hypothetical protein [Salmonella enterica subsp. enterica serovar Mishmarhaemek]ECT1559005.1 hypothetical prot